MSKKRVTLSVDSNVYNEYKKFCEKRGIILSKQFELFMEQELKNKKRLENGK